MRALSSRRLGIVRGAATALVLAAVAAAVVFDQRSTSHGGWAQTESKSTVRVVDTSHSYTFAQAVAHGVVPSLQAELLQSGLPLCGTKGPTSAKARVALKKVIARNDGDTCMADPRGATFGVGGIEDLYALNARPAGSRLLRYVDSAGWSVTYPRTFHGAAYLIDPGFHVSTEGASFANFGPVTTPFDSGDDPGAGTHVPPSGVLFQVTASFGLGLAPIADRDSRVPLSLGRSLDPHATSPQAGSVDFQILGQHYQASFVTGPKASPGDLEALRRMIDSLAFRPLETGTETGQYTVLGRTSAYPTGSAALEHSKSRSTPPSPFFVIRDRTGFHAIVVLPDLHVGGKPCKFQFDPATDQIFCSAGARWDDQGRLVALPRLTSPPDLTHFQTLISFDGHVLVDESALLPTPPQ
jgi:hypothetical protein